MKKKTVCLLTATRAEWGLLRPLAQRIRQMPELELLIAATGIHFCSSYGSTYQEILKDGFEIGERVDIQLFPESPAAISKTMGLALMGFADLFERRQIDLLVVLGDRYETIAVCLAAANAQVPIAHIHGGETTEGAVDEGIRHAITKLSSLHFAACESYRRRIIQMGEQPDRVFNSGALSVDNICAVPCMTRSELSESLRFDLSGDYAVVTFHPVTLERETGGNQCLELFAAMLAYPEMRYLITKSNADLGGAQINRMIDSFAADHPERVAAFSSLGAKRYLNAVRHARMVLGNSSSGILEAPTLRVPTVNIGDRQRGRLHVPSIIDCAPRREEIGIAMQRAVRLWDGDLLRTMPLPYGDGHAAEKIVQAISAALDKGIDLKKKFYDLGERN